jgi:hypothetical protein
VRVVTALPPEVREPIVGALRALATWAEGEGRMLRLVKPEGTKPPRKKGGPRHEAIVLSPDEQRKARQAIRNLKDAFGSWACLADAMGMPVKSLINEVVRPDQARQGSVTATLTCS